MAEIVNENQVAINEIVFTVQGKVQRFLASQFAPKTVIGGYDDESDPVVSRFTWDRFDGGLGLAKMASVSDRNRVYQGDLHIKQPGELTLNPLALSLHFDTTATGGFPALPEYLRFTDFNGTLWGANLSAVASWADSVGWSASVFEPSDTRLRSATHGVVNDTDVLILTGDTGGIYYSPTPSDSTTWVTDTGIGNPIYTAVYRDVLWGISDAGQLSFTPDFTSGWTQTATLPVESLYIVGLIVAPAFRNGGISDGLYAVTRTGLYLYDDEQERFGANIIGLPPSFLATSTKRNFASGATVWNGAIYYFHNSDVYRITPGQAYVVDRISPPFFDRPARTSPTTLPGPVSRIHGITSGPTGVYIVTVGDGSNSGYTFEWDGTIWQQLGRAERLNHPFPSIAGPGVQEHNQIYYSAVADEPRVVVTGQTSSNSPWYWPIPEKQGLTSDTSLRYPYTGTMDTPFFDGFVAMNKLAVSCDVQYVLPDTQDSIELYYRTDADDSFIQIGSTDTLDPLPLSGTWSAKFTDSSNTQGLPFDQLQLRITLKQPSGDSTDTTHFKHTPIVRRMSLNYIKSQTLRWGYRCVITGSPGLTPTETFRELQSLIGNRLHEFTFTNDVTGSPEVDKVKVIDIRSAEESGYGHDAQYVVSVVQAV